MKILITLAAVALALNCAYAEQKIPEGSQLVIPASEMQAVKGSDKVFTGDVTVQQLSEPLPGMAAGSGMVTFQPGSRSFWHTHPIGQVLIILKGEGRSGVYGEKVSVLKKGDLVVCPKGVKHFHGAAPDQKMVQMTITGTLPDGQNVEWMEPVTDEQYNNIK
ncbi:MAG: cupin domain-containing protein [Burkholderiales bacterium]|nr:cupin domain-containing protein [Burkholderiales bacterium]